VAFAQLNRLSAGVVGWNYPKIGPILRCERRHLLWRAPEYAASGRICLLLQSLCMDRQNGPAIQRFDIAKSTAFVFTEIPRWSDYFRAFMVADLLWPVRSNN
jgi:hypothetical protein